MARTKTSQLRAASPPPPASRTPKVSIPNYATPSLGRTVMEGFAFGTGSSVARTITQRLFEKKEPEKHVHNVAPIHGGHDNEIKEWCKTLKEDMLRCIDIHKYNDLYVLYERMCKHDYT